jgi:hypothetical protein
LEAKWKKLYTKFDYCKVFLFYTVGLKFPLSKFLPNQIIRLLSVSLQTAANCSVRTLAYRRSVLMNAGWMRGLQSGGSLQTKKKRVQLPSEIKFAVMTSLAEIQ